MSIVWLQLEHELIDKDGKAVIVEQTTRATLREAKTSAMWEARRKGMAYVNTKQVGSFKE